MTKVPQDNNTTNTPVDYCALSTMSQDENGGTTNTITNNPVDVVPHIPKNLNFEKTAPVNSPKQRKLESYDITEEDCTGGYDIEWKFGPLFDENEEEGEKDFDKNSGPVS